jgi:hypothetical protein
MASDVTDRVVWSTTVRPEWLVEIINPGAGPRYVFPGRTREACRKWVDNFNREVSKSRGSGQVKVARVITFAEKES